MTTSKILVVEDDKNLLDILGFNLNKEGYKVITAVDGAEAEDVAHRSKPDLIILDVMLPKLSGFEVCRILRRETNVPILLLTAKDDEIDKVVGLELGADDYMTKPFSMRELLARVRAMLRRAEMSASKPAADSTIISTNDLEIDVARRQAVLNGVITELTPKEFDLLAFLVQNKGLVFSREQLLTRVWGYDYAGDTRTVDVHIRWLRKKIEANPSKPEHLVTVRGVGYKLEG